MNLRFEALAAVSRNPGAPLDELVGMLSVSGKPARQAVLDAKKGGLLSLMRDDVTGQPGYVLTDAGKKRLADGPDKLNGSNMIKGVQPEHLKKAAEKAEPKTEPVAPAPEHDDINVADSMPPADPVLLASANRMLSDRLAGVAHALRGSSLEALRNIDDGEDLQQHVAALAGAHKMAIEDRDSAYDLINILKRNLAKCEALRKSLEAAQSRGDDRPVEGYLALGAMFETKIDARRYAEDAIVSDEQKNAVVYELRLIGTAKRSAEWVPA